MQSTARSKFSPDVPFPAARSISMVTAAPTDDWACLSSRLLALFSLLRACCEDSSEANEVRRARSRSERPWISELLSRGKRPSTRQRGRAC
eukprot:1258919-Alexandrium_andersonii.AAC.1